MQVSLGWNTAYGKEKFDVRVEEEDLRRMLTEHGLDAALADSLGATTAFRLLYLEAQVFSHTVLVGRLERLAKVGNPTSEDKDRYAIATQDKASATADRAALLDAIRAGKVK